MGAEYMKGLNVDFCLHGTSHSSSCLDNTVLCSAAPAGTLQGKIFLACFHGLG